MIPERCADVLREHRVDLDRDIDGQFPEDADLPGEHWIGCARIRLSPFREGLSFLEIGGRGTPHRWISRARNRQHLLLTIQEKSFFTWQS